MTVSTEDHSGHTEHTAPQGHRGTATAHDDQHRPGPHADGRDDTHHGAHAAPGGHGDHSTHAGHDPDAFRRRFWVSLVLTLPLVAGSPMVMEWFGLDVDLPGADWWMPVLGTAVFAWGGWPFLEGAVREVRRRQPGMMLLIAQAITVAYVASVATSIGWFDLDFWWELAALVTIMLLGHWQEMKAIGQAQGALSALAALVPDGAERIGPDGEPVTVPAAEVEVGDVVLVRAGGRVPADGEVLEGTAEVDESMVTGESRPVVRASGDRVIAGTVSTDSALRVRVTAVGADTALAGIERLVAEAQTSRSRSQVLADRFAALLFYVATATAVLTFATWAALGDLDAAVVRTVTVLVIACPHALGLAIPLVVALTTALAARNGILVKDRLALERMRLVDTVLFDKTGTLTAGAHAVTEVAGGDGVTADEVLALAAAVEADSEHPLARAIVARGRAAGPVPTATDFTSRTGRGVEARVGDVRYAVGGPALLRETGAAVPEALVQTTERWAERGAAVLHLLADGRVVGALALEDEVRPEATEAVARLRAEGVTVAMITGDARNVAESVGRQVGVDTVLAEVLPEDKDLAVTELQEQGHRVAMVGDGVNDAPALARADVGLAIGTGTDVAIESGGVVLASDDPRGVLSVIRLSRAGYRKMVQNLGWAVGYNVVAIPLAAGALAWAGVTLSPAVGAVLMSVSTIVVALNAQLLRRVDLRPGASGGHVTGVDHEPSTRR